MKNQIILILKFGKNLILPILKWIQGEFLKSPWNILLPIQVPSNYQDSENSNEWSWRYHKKEKGMNEKGT